MKVWRFITSQATRPVEMLAESEGNIVWVMEKMQSHLGNSCSTEDCRLSQ